MNPVVEICWSCYELAYCDCIMMQESVYCKLLLNSTAEQLVQEAIRKIKPPKGVIQLLTITEKQFAGIEYLVGKFHSDIIDSDERMVIL